MRQRQANIHVFIKTPKNDGADGGVLVLQSFVLCGPANVRIRKEASDLDYLD